MISVRLLFDALARSGFRMISSRAPESKLGRVRQPRGAKVVLKCQVVTHARQGVIDPFIMTVEEFERVAKPNKAISLAEHAGRFLPITDTARSISCLTSLY